jgi:hypothetical protein
MTNCRVAWVHGWHGPSAWSGALRVLAMTSRFQWFVIASRVARLESSRGVENGTNARTRPSKTRGRATRELLVSVRSKMTSPLILAEINDKRLLEDETLLGAGA